MTECFYCNEPIDPDDAYTVREDFYATQFPPLVRRTWYWHLACEPAELVVVTKYSIPLESTANAGIWKENRPVATSLI